MNETENYIVEELSNQLDNIKKELQDAENDRDGFEENLIVAEDKITDLENEISDLTDMLDKCKSFISDTAYEATQLERHI